MSVTSVSSDELNKNILKVRVMAEHNLVAGFVPNNLSVLFKSVILEYFVVHLYMTKWIFN